jgi:endonuclease III
MKIKSLPQKTANKSSKSKPILKSDKERIVTIAKILESQYPQAGIQLEFEDSFQLLAATILSAQCTDARVNQVTEKLFQKYQKLEDYISAPIEELEKAIFSTGYYRAKARHIKAAAQIVKEKFRGKVPATLTELLEIPGVGRKTANVLLGNVFDQPAIVVDTHVIRITNRLGFVSTKNAVKIEKRISEILPEKYWVNFTHYLILFGRAICPARKPKCYECVLNDLCPFPEKTKK